MSSAKYISRVGALAVALGVMATTVPASVSKVAPAVKLSADSTALIMGGTTVPTPDDYFVGRVQNQLIAPTHPGQDIDYVAVTTPEEEGPFTGLVRILGSALGPPEIWGPGGAGWPDEPWWKLSGLFDLPFTQSVQAGVADLETAMAQHGNDHLVIFGYSQGALIAVQEKRRLAQQFPAGTEAPDIDFVLLGDANLPNGGLLARFPGLYIPILDLHFDGSEPTDTQFDTAVINRQYDGWADFPLYPLNVVADLNALLGVFYVHLHDLDVSLAPDPSTSPAYQGTHGDSSYYFFETKDLPLFGPLRTLGVPEPVIDVIEPFFREIVELGYDRSIPPWEPTPARLFPTLDPAKVTADLVDAIGEGINNAAALIGAPAPLKIPVPVTTAAPRQSDAPPITEPTKAVVSPRMTPTEAVSETSQVTSAPTPTRTNPASASTPKSTKPADQPATPRPVVRGSLGVGQQVPKSPQRGNGSSSAGNSSHGSASSDADRSQ